MGTIDQEQTINDRLTVRIAEHQATIDSLSAGCLTISVVLFVGATGLWLLRDPRWGIPGFVCLGAMGLAWSFIMTTKKNLYRPQGLNVACPKCEREFQISRTLVGDLECPGCKSLLTVPSHEYAPPAEPSSSATNPALVTPGHTDETLQESPKGTEDKRGTSGLSTSHPDLYGALVNVEAAMKSEGSGLSNLGVTVTSILACVAIWFDWYRAVPGLGAIDLHRWWVYGLVFFSWLFTVGALIARLERISYDKHRESLKTRAAAAGLSRFEMLSLIEHDTALANVRKRIADDAKWQA